VTLVCAPDRIRAVLDPVHPIDADAVGRLHEYTRVLDRWAARQRLVGWRRAEALLAEGIRDAWSAVPLLAELEAPIVDVGSGAGLPALVFAAALPARTVHLLEARRKRASFLREAIRLMGVTAATLHHGRAHEVVGVGLDPAGAVVTSRAFAAPEEVLDLADAWGASACLVTSSEAKIPDASPEGWEAGAPVPSRPSADSLHVLYRRTNSR